LIDENEVPGREEHRAVQLSDLGVPRKSTVEHELSNKTPNSGGRFLGVKRQGSRGLLIN
jgi:hypothetical protein